MLDVKEKPLGTITNDNGAFVLKIPNDKYVSTDSLIISFLGYHKQAGLILTLLPTVLFLMAKQN